jgi:tRNA A-37 threonylcarbamoyl transferase component Bud32
MNKPPFTLKIKTSSPPGRCEEVVCRGVLRALGKTRMVYDATWEGRRIVLKVFAKFGKARYHAMREWRGLKQLEARQVNSPRPLFFGRSCEGWAIATEWLDNAVTAGELWQTADAVEKRVETLCLVARELARQHDRGVVQPDMHLGNFMIRGQEVFALDPAMMRFARSPIGRRQSIRQVAQLAGLLPEDAGSAIESVFREYAGARSWTIGPQDLERVRDQHRRCRRQGLERGLRKFLRTNRRHQAIRCGPWRGLADREFSAAVNLDEITTRLDEILSQGRILKDGRTSFVSRVTLGDTEVVIKRYNHLGWLHALRHTLKGSRARRSWLNANRLSLLGIPTPRPLAYIDERRGPFLYRSYFIAEFVPGQGLYGVLRDGNVPEDRKRQLVAGVVHALDEMASHRISHGDLKHTNMLCDGDRIVFMDLDGMHVDRIAWLQRCRHRRDLARFLRDVPVR